jgi:hypothetical protein
MNGRTAGGRKKVGPDPLKISPINPLDYRQINGQWVLDPGWWRNIKTGEDESNRQSLSQKKQGRRKRG